MRVPRPLALTLVCTVVLTLTACGGDGDADDADPGGDANPAPTTELATAVTTSGAGRTATLDGETFVSDRTLPPDALSAERLEAAGTATADGETLAMAHAASNDVAGWEVVSAAPQGWLVWQPAVVLQTLQDAGAGAALVSVEAVDWPNACLGAPRADEVCAEVITPGYLVTLEQSGETIEYHASRAGRFRRVVAESD